MGCCTESSVAVVGGSFACACAVGSGGPRCAAAVCPALSFDAEGGTVVISNGGTYPSTTTYVCEGGAPPLGTTTRECRPDGSWSEGEPGACPTCDDGAQNGDEMGADCGGATCATCFSFAATFLDTCNGVKLYQTQPLICPLASGVDANKQALLEWYHDECAKGGKVAIACGDDSHYKSTDAGSIGARRMPTSYSCNMDEHLAAVTGWTNLFAISDSSAVVVGIDYHNAAQGETVQLVCADAQ